MLGKPMMSAMREIPVVSDLKIPERSFVYRFVKKHFFNDFGAYANPLMPEGLDAGSSRSPSTPPVVNISS